MSQGYQRIILGIYQASSDISKAYLKHFSHQSYEYLDDILDISQPQPYIVHI